MATWPYDARRAAEYPKLREPITYRQIGYIKYLSGFEIKGSMLDSIMASITPGNLSIRDLTKGQAMYVIKCLQGEIEPED